MESGGIRVNMPTQRFAFVLIVVSCNLWEFILCDEWVKNGQMFNIQWQNKRMNEHVGILQKKLCIFTKVYFSNTLYLTSKIVYTMPEMNQIIV